MKPTTKEVEFDKCYRMGDEGRMSEDKIAVNFASFGALTAGPFTGAIVL